MLPVIVQALDSKTRQDYLKAFIKDNKVDRFSLFTIEPVKNQITIDQIRQIKKQLITASREKRVFIIYDFDCASIEAQAAMLKTLEETNMRTFFILFVSNQEKILSTVRSRSKIVIYNQTKQPQETLKKIDKVIDKILKSPNYGFFAEKEIQLTSREEASEFINSLIFYFKNKLKSGDIRVAKILKKTMSLKKLLTENYLNPQLTVDNLLIYIKKTYSMKL